MRYHATQYASAWLHCKCLNTGDQKCKVRPFWPNVSHNMWCEIRLNKNKSHTLKHSVVLGVVGVLGVLVSGVWGVSGKVGVVVVVVSFEVGRWVLVSGGVGALVSGGWACQVGLGVGVRWCGHVRGVVSGVVGVFGVRWGQGVDFRWDEVLVSGVRHTAY